MFQLPIFNETELQDFNKDQATSTEDYKTMFKRLAAEVEAEIEAEKELAAEQAAEARNELYFGSNSALFNDEFDAEIAPEWEDGTWVELDDDQLLPVGGF